MTNREACVNWIKEYFEDNPDGKAIIGISGGKDSTIAAALCVEALGADRVIGVLMPQGKQNDIDDSYKVCEVLNIPNLAINIGSTIINLCADIDAAYDYGKCCYMNPIVRTNLPARIRMATLYAVAALYPNSRVVNTCNRSEDYVGYSTKYGDAAGDFSPLGNLTVREVLGIGDELGLPYHLVHKTPSDGMCGKSDEDNLGFTYEELDNYILKTAEVSEETKEKIDRLHKSSRHKYKPMPMFDPTVLYIDKDQLTIDDYADGGLVSPDFNAAAMSSNAIMTGLGNVDPINYGEIDLQKIAETINKVIETAGYAFKGE
jgi:NAD+ synthase